MALRSSAAKTSGQGPRWWPKNDNPRLPFGAINTFRDGDATRPVRYVPQLLGIHHQEWNDGNRNPFERRFRERNMEETWPFRQRGWEKGYDYKPVLTQRYSKEAIQEALTMIPDWFETKDIPRPPQRIKAQSEGIVGSWFTNYWTLHSMKYQCLLAGIPWRYGDRVRPRTNYDEPYYFVDFAESKAIRDYRSRWINVHRSMVDSCKKVKEAEDDLRFLKHKRLQDQFWSERKTLITRVKSMRASKTLTAKDEMPLKGMNLRAFEA